MQTGPAVFKRQRQKKEQKLTFAIQIGHKINKFKDEVAPDGVKYSRHGYLTIIRPSCIVDSNRFSCTRRSSGIPKSIVKCFSSQDFPFVLMNLNSPRLPDSLIIATIRRHFAEQFSFTPRVWKQARWHDGIRDYFNDLFNDEPISLEELMRG